MRLSRVTHVADPGAAPPGEDLAWSGEDLALVMDGATGLGPSLVDGATSDARWFVDTVAEHVRRRWSRTHEIVTAVRAALVDTAAEWPGPRDLPAHRLPSAGLALVALEGDEVVFVRVGDCEAFVRTPDGVLPVFSGSPLHELDEEALRVLVDHRASGATPGEALALVRPLLIANRELLNTPEGYPALSLTRVERMVPQVRRFPARVVERVLLATDGFTCAWRSYGLPGPVDWLDRASSAVADTLRALRVAEDADPDGDLFARFKPHDDATALVVDLGQAVREERTEHPVSRGARRSPPPGCA